MGRDTLTTGTLRSQVAYLGDYPEEIWVVLEKAWDGPIWLASDFARAYKEQVALAASLGWISSIHPGGLGYSDRWHLTLAGFQALRDLKPKD